jgi:uncharacterized lipoprotein YajG
MHKHPLLAVVVLWVAFVLLAGCASFDRRLDTAYQVHTATTRTVTNALDARLIPSDDAIAFQEIAVNSRLVLDSARAVKDTDAASAEGKLQLANDILLQLQRYLIERGAK